MNSLRQLTYLAQWFLDARILGHHRPLQSVVFVTGGCDATCRHCTRCGVSDDHLKSFDEIVRDFRSCYDAGARILDIEGVNLLRWRDGDRTPKDIFASARNIGFFNISTMIPVRDWREWRTMAADADVLWISISGAEDLPLLESDAKASLYMVVNSQNHGDIPTVLEYMKQHSNLEQIAFNFHTPFPGTEAMALSAEERKTVIDSLISFKKQGHRIMNTVSGLKNMLSLDFKRYCWICNFIYCDGRKSPVCIDDESTGICSECGFCMSGEMNAVFRFKPDTILTGLKSRT